MTQVYYSKGDPWDAHGDIFAHKVNAKNSDQAFAAVIKDLEGPRHVERYSGSMRVRVWPHPRCARLAAPVAP
jgi:hypothetical protein